MSFQTKETSLQAYSMLLYRNALHPEFFGIEGRRRIEHGDYEFEGWIFRGGHALRFELDGLCLTEIIIDQTESLPERGLAASFACAGEKDHDATFGDRLVYMTSIQTELLTDHLYLGTYTEMLEHGRECEGLMSMWSDESGNPTCRCWTCSGSATRCTCRAITFEATAAWCCAHSRYSR